MLHGSGGRSGAPEAQVNALDAARGTLTLAPGASFGRPAQENSTVAHWDTPALSILDKSSVLSCTITALYEASACVEVGRRQGIIGRCRRPFLLRE